MECSMCGDVGFADHLFQCSKCQFRFQHRYCSRGYFFGDHTELCDWCFVESDQITKSKRPLTKKVDGKRSNASNSVIRRSANAHSQKPTGWSRSASKTDVQKTRLAPARSRLRMKLLHEIVC